MLDLLRPIYLKTAAYGHFGRDEPEFTWEATDKVEALKEELERRLRFADLRLKQDEKRGSETDRGLVFVLLGPPSYVGQSPLKSTDEDDAVQSSRNADMQETFRSPDGRATTRLVPRVALTAQTIQGTRETWHYRRDRLPRVRKVSTSKKARSAPVPASSVIQLLVSAASRRPPARSRRMASSMAGRGTAISATRRIISRAALRTGRTTPRPARGRRP